MICPGCNEKNRDGARFCTYCGIALAQRCPVCDTEIVAGGRFCDSCGAPIDAPSDAPAPSVAARKVVTVLFADLTGSTALEEHMDAESVRSVLDRFYAAMRAEVERFGGRLVKFTGDGAMVAFGVPDVAEDDAARAVDAALAMREELSLLASDLSLDLSLKIGINTGEVVVAGADDDVVGDAVNVASRLEGAASAGEILAGEDTWRLTRATARYEPVAPLTLKGKSEPVPAYRLLSVDERTADSATTPFVGRDTELGTLLAAFQEAVDANAARLVTIIGSPGLGKTRLARELMSELSDAARVRETRCDPAGSATFAPIADALRGAAAISETASEDDVIAALAARIPAGDPDRDRIALRAAAIFGVGQPGTTEETFWALRRLLEAAASEQPVVLVLDDVHWAEPLLLDLIEHMAEWIRTAPVLLVITGRPELRDLRPSLVEGGRAAAVIALEGLDRDATARLALNLLGAEDDGLPDELLAKIPASTEGNPLFVRELVRMLVDDGVLLRTADGWNVTVDVDAIQVPPTIQSLLSARVERLRSDERTVVELASVVGKEFYRGALHDLAPASVRPLVDGCLESLRRKELVEPAGTYWIDEPVYRFHHALIRDAAYRRLLKESRAELHERVAEWLEGKTADVLGEHDETIGYHLEQAYDYRRQLGRADEQLGRRAAALLGAAAQRALDRDDLPAAAGLSGRALDVLPTEDAQRAELLLVRCEALLSMGDVVHGADAVSELELIASTPRLVAWSTCFAGQLANLTSPERLHQTELRVAAAASEFAELSDPAGAAKAHTVHASTLAGLGQFAECEAALDRALTAAREAGDRRRVTAVLGAAPLAALWGPSPVSRAGGRCLDVVRLLRITTGSPAVEAISLRSQAVLEAFRGRADAARRMLRKVRRDLTELGLEHELLATEQFAGIVELVGGDASVALAHLRAAHEGFRDVGVDVLAAQSAALLARAHLLLGEDAEAEAFVGTSEQLGSQDLKTAIAWRSVRAELLARRGEFDEAKRVAESAVELASHTDALIDHGNACRSLANVCRAAGDAGGARNADERAFALFERKGATALADRERDVLPAEIKSAAPATTEMRTNRCAEALRAWNDAFERRDWERLAAFLADDYAVEDRRTLFSARGRGREAGMTAARSLAEIGVTRVDSTVIATRGELLALTHSVFRGDAEDGATPFEGRVLGLTEIAPDGALVRGLIFDPEALDAAMAELDERFIAGPECADPEMVRLWSRFDRAYAARDWDAMLAVFAADAVIVDHRPASFGTPSGPAELVRFIRELTDQLGPRIEVLAPSIHCLEPGRGVYQFVVRSSNAEGGTVEINVLLFMESRDGVIVTAEIFPPEQLPAAKQRFAESPNELLRNRASRYVERWTEMLLARDWDALDGMYADDVVWMDRRPGFQVETVGRGAALHNLRETAAIGVRRIDHTILALRGERLVLTRDLFGGDAFEAELLFVTELDDDGLCVRRVAFAPDDLDAATAELDERLIAGEGAEYADLLRLGSQLIRDINHRDWGAVRAAIADDAVFVDHRPASLGEMHGPDEWIESYRALVEVFPVRAEVFAFRLLTADGLVAEARNYGVTSDGSDVESPFQAVVRVADGRIVRMEFFAVDELDAALRCFNDRPVPRDQSETTALRIARLYADCLVRRDWEQAGSLMTEDSEWEDRRPGFKNTVRGVAPRIESLQELARIGVDRIDVSVVATRGDRLLLSRTVVGASARDTFETEVLILSEVDELERLTDQITFDPHDLSGALNELTERFANGEGAAFASQIRLGNRVTQSIADRDWDALRACLTENFVYVDHRLASLGEMDADGWIGSLRVLADIAPGTRPLQVAIRSIDRDRAIHDMLLTSRSDDGDPLETAFLSVVQIRNGRWARGDVYPHDEPEAALMRFEELGLGGESRRLPPNGAIRSLERWAEAFSQQNWFELRACYAERFVREDRRRALQVSGDVDQHIEVSQEYADLGMTRARFTPIATRGAGLVLANGAFSDGAGNEISLLIVLNVDDHQHWLHAVEFDLDDLDQAFTELDLLFASGEGSPHAEVVRLHSRHAHAFAVRDWDTLRAILSDDFCFVDHRPASFGELSADQWIETLKALEGMVSSAYSAPVAYHAVDARRALIETHNIFTSEDGSSVETVMHFLVEHRDERWTRAEVFPEDQLDAALARFRELDLEALTDAVENDAVRMFVRGVDLASRGELWALGKEAADEAVIEDRRAGLKWTYEGKSAVLDHMQQLRGTTSHVSPLATRGERLCLARHVVVSGDFEVEVIALMELDDRGMILRGVFFDVGDLDAAFAELEERYIAGECAPYPDVGHLIMTATPAWNARDWDSFGATFAVDVVHVDRRAVAHAVMRGRDEVVAAAKALVEVIPDVRHDAVAVHAIDQHAVVAEFRARGTNNEGGEVEIAYVTVSILRDGVAGYIERFDVDQIDDALRAFESLRPVFAPAAVRSSSAPENACTRTADALRSVFVAGTWDAYEAAVSENVVYEDRRAGLRDRFEGRRAFMDLVGVITDLGPHFAIDIIATRGDRLALVKLTWSNKDTGPEAFRVETLDVIEVDTNGDLSAIIGFETDDFDAAFAELDSRFAVMLDDARAEVVRSVAAVMSAYNTRDWDRFAEPIASDFVLVDHIPASAGSVVGRDAYISYVRSLTALAADARIDMVRDIAVEVNGGISEVLLWGTSADGGHIEIRWLDVAEIRHGLLVRLERFPFDRIDVAKARFREL